MKGAQNKQTSLATEIDEDDVAAFADRVLSDEELAKRAGWRYRANCRDTEVFTWFPIRRASRGISDSDTDDEPSLIDETNIPKARCRRCTVRFECLSEALHEDTQGIWGGTSHILRHKIRDHLSENNPEVLSPSCGTVSGWMHHRRFDERDDEKCVPCIKAASDAGYSVLEERLNPLTLSFGLDEFA